MLSNAANLFVCVFAFLFIPCIGNSQDTPPEEIARRFFELYESEGSDQAVDYVFSTNKWLNGEKTTVEAIKTQLKKGIAIIGQYYGYELAEKKSMGENYVLLSYILRYDRQPIKFVFILYRPNKDWQIQNLKFDDRLDDDIEGSSH